MQVLARVLLATIVNTPPAYITNVIYKIKYNYTAPTYTPTHQLLHDNCIIDDNQNN